MNGRSFVKPKKLNIELLKHDIALFHDLFFLDKIFEAIKKLPINIVPSIIRFSGLLKSEKLVTKGLLIEYIVSLKS